MSNEMKPRPAIQYHDYRRAKPSKDITKLAMRLIDCLRWVRKIKQDKNEGWNLIKLELDGAIEAKTAEQISEQVFTEWATRNELLL